MDVSKITTLESTGISALAIILIQWLKQLFALAPEITFFVQLTIGLLTIILLVFKILTFFKKNKS